MRSGYEDGYQVITLNDCVAATSIEEHDNTLTYDFPMFSHWWSHLPNETGSWYPAASSRSA